MASYTFCGSALPSPSPSTPYERQVLGMNCIGPTARSQTVSPSRAPPSVSGIDANPFPFRAGPKTPGSTRWSGVMLRPRMDEDSTSPMAARSETGMRQEAGADRAAARYASARVDATPGAVRPPTPAAVVPAVCPCASPLPRRVPSDPGSGAVPVTVSTGAGVAAARNGRSIGSADVGSCWPTMTSSVAACGAGLASSGADGRSVRTTRGTTPTTVSTAAKPALATDSRLMARRFARSRLREDLIGTHPFAVRSTASSVVTDRRRRHSPRTM